MNAKEYDVNGKVATMIGVPNATLRSAVQAGHVEHVELGLGTILVDIASAKRWAKSDRKPGRKPRATGPS